jgi:N-formylmaleamate deformylase
MTQFAYPSHRITANGIDLHFYRSTPPRYDLSLVLLHGLTDNGMCWIRVADDLREDYDLILPDTRGHGLSAKPEGPYDIETRAADVAGLIEALELDRPVLMGHSLGGQAALAVAALYPERVRAIIAEDPAWLDESPEEQRHASMEEWVAGLCAQQAQTVSELMATVQADNPHWHELELRPWADAKLQVTEHALREILMSMRGGWRDQLARVQCPVLILTPDPDNGIVSPAMADECMRLNERVRVANIPGTGHCIHRDRFEASMEPVRAFLKEIA